VAWTTDRWSNALAGWLAGWPAGWLVSLTVCWCSIVLLSTEEQRSIESAAQGKKDKLDEVETDGTVRTVSNSAALV
jgi:hypothetical protein